MLPGRTSHRNASRALGVVALAAFFSCPTSFATEPPEPKSSNADTPEPENLPKERQREVLRYLRFIGDHGDPPSPIKTFLREEDLPYVASLLEVPELWKHWPRMRQSLAMVGNDPSWLPALIEQVTRDESLFDGLSAPHAYALIVGKAATLRWIGYIGGDEAEQLLWSAVTHEGARQWSHKWQKTIERLDRTSHFSEERLLLDIRSHALLGLIYSGSEQSAERIEEQYRQLRIEAREQKPLRQKRWLYHLREALVKRDAMAEYGRDGFLELDLLQSLESLRKHRNRYETEEKRK